MSRRGQFLAYRENTLMSKSTSLTVRKEIVCKKSMRDKKLLLSITALLLLLTGCFSLEPFYFRNESVDKYFKTQDMAREKHYRGIIPQSLIKADSFVVEGDTIFAFWAMQPIDTLKQLDKTVTILYSHGNLRNINTYWDRVELLWELGYRVYIYDYPGFGRSQGKPSSAACFSSAKAALNRVYSNPNVDTANVVFYGYSLGTYVATYLASEVRAPVVLTLESAAASSSAFIEDSGLLDLPGGVISDDDFDNEKRIAHINCPLLMIHGKADAYVVFNHHVPKLWELAKEPKDSLWIENAGHGNIPYIAGNTYTKKIVNFITAHTSKKK